MPDPNDQDQNQQDISGDMLEQLLAVAAEKAAKREADEALRKGYVTREQINMALGELKNNTESELVNKFKEILPEMVELSVRKAITVDEQAKRKGTVLGSSPTLDDRENDPVDYLIRKGKELGPDSYDDVDKRILWAVTHKALSLGMIEDQGEPDI
jgi:hypothetical protein